MTSIPSWWIMLIFAAGAAAILVAEAFNYELPAIDPAGRLGGLPDQRHLHRDPDDLPRGQRRRRKIGLFLALIFSLIATVLTVMHWREEGK